MTDEDIDALLDRLEGHVDDGMLPPPVSCADAAAAIRFLRSERDKAQAQLDRMRTLLADPVAVHINMLRGYIAKPSLAAIRHAYLQDGRDVLVTASELDEARALLRWAREALGARVEGEGGTDDEHECLARIDAALASEPSQSRELLSEELW
jgi:hypothetical protein